jgi:hypothetical protein
MLADAPYCVALPVNAQQDVVGTISCSGCPAVSAVCATHDPLIIGLNADLVCAYVADFLALEAHASEEE